MRKYVKQKVLDEFLSKLLELNPHIQAEDVSCRLLLSNVGGIPDFVRIQTTLAKLKTAKKSI